VSCLPGMTSLSCLAASAGASAITAANPLIRIDSVINPVQFYRYTLAEVKVGVTITRSTVNVCTSKCVKSTHQWMNQGPGLTVVKRNVTLSLFACNPIDILSLLMGFTKLYVLLPGTLMTSNACYDDHQPGFGHAEGIKKYIHRGDASSAVKPNLVNDMRRSWNKGLPVHRLHHPAKAPSQGC
jgi:hypothetical protein